MHVAEGKNIDVIAPAGGFVKDTPYKYGSLIIMPNMTVSEGVIVSARWKGLFYGAIKAGDEPAFAGEPAYFKGNEFTKTKPADAGDVKVPVGVFVDGGVLLTGVTLAA